MKGWDPRWWLAGIVVTVWSIVVIIDAVSTEYAVDAGLHVGCGGILGVLLGSGLLNRKNGEGG